MSLSGSKHQPWLSATRSGLLPLLICIGIPLLPSALLAQPVDAGAASDGSAVVRAFTTGSMSGRGMIFQALTNPDGLSGEVRAYRLSSGLDGGEGGCAGLERGQLCEDLAAPYWQASDGIPDPTERVIITRADGVPAAFGPNMLDDLSLAQQRGLVCVSSEPCQLSDPLGPDDERRALAEARVEYLRGNDDPAEGLQFRERSGPLGDIWGSNLVLVGPPARLFQDQGYRDFRTTHADREPVLFVGANDGMLHAFAAADGSERFAYIPEAVYTGLADLGHPDYGSRPGKRAFVDGEIKVADVDMGGSIGWQTILIGSLGRGAQGVYALNITEPLGVTEVRPEILPLWEFTDASGDDQGLDGRELGFNTAPPAIVRIDPDLDDDSPPTWIALVSNGYQSTNEVGEEPARCGDRDAASNCTISQTGNAVLYVLNIAGSDADRIRAILDTGVGMDDDPLSAADGATAESAAGAARANGLAEATAVDADGDLIADIAYAGDLFGNLWRFDLVDLSGVPERVFRAMDDDGVPQPITSKISVQRHPTGVGQLLLFGTGPYPASEGSGRPAEAPAHSLYGIWDEGGLIASGDRPITREALLEQSFVAEKAIDASGGGSAGRGRISTEHRIAWLGDDAPRGWYIDLEAGESGGAEHLVAPVQVRNDRVVFMTMAPQDCCSWRGQVWMNALNVEDGSRPSVVPFAMNADGAIDDGDLLRLDGEQSVVGSSLRLDHNANGEHYSMPAVVALSGSHVQSMLSTPSGELVTFQESAPLHWRNWQQLQ